MIFYQQSYFMREMKFVPENIGDHKECIANIDRLRKLARAVYPEVVDGGIVAVTTKMDNLLTEHYNILSTAKVLTDQVRDVAIHSYSVCTMLDKIYSSFAMELSVQQMRLLSYIDHVNRLENKIQRFKKDK